MKKSKTCFHSLCHKAISPFAIVAFIFAAQLSVAQDSLWMKVSVVQQKLFLMSSIDTLRSYDISTSKNGIGSEQDSYMTPLGLHSVVEKYGEGAPEGTIFISRIKTSKIAPIEFDTISTGVEYVTSRILRLAGLEFGLNQGENIDSYERYIYIHGTHEEGLIGRPASKGCIRMRNKEVIELFDLVPIGTTIRIDPE
jgi:hypothetical protein